MEFSAEELHAIVGRSSTLTERLGTGVISTGSDQTPAATRLARWKHLAANGDEAVFRRVLRTLGAGDFSEKELLSRLGDVRTSSGNELPVWATILQEIVATISETFLTGGDPNAARLVGKNRLIPFAKLYLPIVAFARGKVTSMVSGGSERMRSTAWSGLESYLLGRISDVCSLPLQPRFLAYRAVRQAGATLARFGKYPRARNDGPAGSLFEAFVLERGREGLLGFSRIIRRQRA